MLSWCSAVVQMKSPQIRAKLATKSNDEVRASEVMLSSSHWGIFRPVVSDGRLVAAKAFAADPDPSRLLQSIPSAIHHKSRVLRPAVRKSWLENGPGAHPERRGGDRYVEVGWDQALDLVAGELKRVIADFGNQAIYGGSYGWAS